LLLSHIDQIAERNSVKSTRKRISDL